MCRRVRNFDGSFHLYVGSLSKPFSDLNRPSLRQTQQFHARIISAGLAANPHHVGSLTAALSLSQTVPSDYATLILNHLLISTVFAANNLIRCFAKSRSPLQSVHLYAFMRKTHHLNPNKYTFPFIFQACARGLALAEGAQIHSHVLLLGFADDVFTRNSLIHLYSTCSEIDCAQKVFDENPHSRDIVTWNALLGAYARDGQMGIARKLFDEMPHRDIISWTIKINGLVHCGQLEEALACFQELKYNNLMPNEAILVTILSAIAQLGLLAQGHEIRKFVHLPFTIPVGTGLIDMYAKCGSIQQAMSVFNSMPKKGISTWNAMICGLASHSHEREALHLFETFLTKGLLPDNITFIGVLNACSRAGLVNEGEYHFKMMIDTYDIEPEMEHFGCMVDMLGRAGLVEKAIRLIEDMPMKQKTSLWPLWATLLGACKIHGEVELGERIGRKVIELDPMHEGHYVQLSGIYANARKWDDVLRVRSLMRDRKGNKGAGWSLIEEEGKVHRFVAGDRDHMRSSDIYSILDIIGKGFVESSCYAENVSLV